MIWMMRMTASWTVMKMMTWTMRTWMMMMRTMMTTRAWDQRTWLLRSRSYEKHKHRYAQVPWVMPRVSGLWLHGMALRLCRQADGCLNSRHQHLVLVLRLCSPVAGSCLRYLQWIKLLPIKSGPNTCKAQMPLACAVPSHDLQ